MPRYYFHVAGTTSYVLDNEGTELASLADARCEAVEDARTLMSNAILNGRDISGRSIEICDDSGAVLLRLPLSDAFSRED